MRKYKGYYIDKVIFNTEKDIDKHIIENTIKSLKNLNAMFLNPRYSFDEKCKISEMMTAKEMYLSTEYGMSEDEIQNLIFA